MSDKMTVIHIKQFSKVCERGTLKVVDSLVSGEIVFCLFFLKEWEPDAGI